MPKLDFVEFLETAGKIGVGSVFLALLLFLIGIYEHLIGHNVPASWLMMLAVLSFGYGSFLAWRNERAKFVAEQQKHEQPNFNLRLGQVLTLYSANTNMTLMCLSGTLINSGSPSVGTVWTARYQSPTLDTTIGYINLLDAEWYWPLSNGRNLVLRRNRMLPAQTMTAIDKGHGCSGRILFEFQGDRRAELASGVAQIWLGCYDCTGRLCQSVTSTFAENFPVVFADEDTQLPDNPGLDFRLPE
jgi:hypothetical protein